jgi:hypothetical protein
MDEAAKAVPEAEPQPTNVRKSKEATEPIEKAKPVI